MKKESIERASAALAKQGFSLAALFEKLPKWALVPSLVTIFGLLVVDLAITDPLPIVDEAALIWALISGLKVLRNRRQIEKEISALENDPDVIMDVEPIAVRRG